MYSLPSPSLLGRHARRPLTRREALTSLGTVGLVAAASPWKLLGDAQGPSHGLAGKDALLVRSVRPPDLETPVAMLDAYLTPVERFFVRSHLPVPTVDAETWRLQVDGEVTTPLSLSLDALKALPPATVTATFECAGNGRAFYQPAVAGIQWERGAVGTAKWTGVRLADVLAKAGVKDGAAFVVMNGADRPLGTMPDFERQLPIDRALHRDTLLVHTMNDAPLTAPHGFPVRVLVPGIEGAYSVKWLTSVRVVRQEFDGFWVASAYRYPTRRVAPGAAVDPKDMAPLTSLVVKSLITRPLHGAVLAPGTIDVAGFAWAGEPDIARVDVSIDHGATWQPARLTGESTKYTWRRFEFSFAATRPESYLVMSRATDAAGRTQPIAPPWNPSGYLWNAPDEVRIDVRG
ncbi:MAG: sulfite oxidase [Vicinamibacterales bacterium]